MRLLAIDPGTEQSAFVRLSESNLVADHGLLGNAELLQRLETLCDDGAGVVVIEQIESFGMPVGRETFATVFWSGRFAQAAVDSGRPFALLPRRTIKNHLCHSVRATDANIRQALIDRYGPGKERAIGSKRLPGPLYGLKGHEYAALAVGLTWHDQHANDVRPHVAAEW